MSKKTVPTWASFVRRLQAFDRRVESTLLHFHPIWRMQKEEEVNSPSLPSVSPPVFWFTLHSLMSLMSPCSARNYTVPDPPGLFDGHVWPMYLKHKNIMEESGVDVCKSAFIFAQVFLNVKYLFFPLIKTLFWPFTVQLDGTKSKEQLFNLVYGDVMNNIQNAQ